MILLSVAATILLRSTEVVIELQFVAGAVAGDQFASASFEEKAPLPRVAATSRWPSDDADRQVQAVRGAVVGPKGMDGVAVE